MSAQVLRALATTGIFALSSIAAISPPTVFPAVLEKGRPEAVLASVAIKQAGAIPSGVLLQRVDSQGRFIATIDRMYDDGTHGDRVSGDNIFTIQFTAPGERSYIRASIPFIGQIQRTNTPAALLDAAPVGVRSKTRPFDSAVRIIQDSLYGRFVANELVVCFALSATPADIMQLVSSWDASIVGALAGFPGCYQLFLPGADSVASLIAARDRATTSPSVLDAT